MYGPLIRSRGISCNQFGRRGTSVPTNHACVSWSPKYLNLLCVKLFFGIVDIFFSASLFHHLHAVSPAWSISHRICVFFFDNCGSFSSLLVFPSTFSSFWSCLCFNQFVFRFLISLPRTTRKSLNSFTELHLWFFRNHSMSRNLWASFCGFFFIRHQSIHPPVYSQTSNRSDPIT